MQFHFGDYFIKILITISIESIGISLGENWCWSPLGLLKGVKGVFERRTPTGSEALSVLICLDDTKFGLLSAFTLLEMICLNVWEKPQLKNATKTTYGWRASLNVFASYIVLFCFCFCLCVCFCLQKSRFTKIIRHYYIDTDEIPEFFLLLKNHIFIARNEIPSALEDKIPIHSRPCNILYLLIQNTANSHAFAYPPRRLSKPW